VSGYIVSPKAQEDLFQIWTYLAREASIATADRVESELYDRFESLARMHGQGHPRSDLTNLPVLFFRAYQFMIVYRVRMPLEIVAVLHGKRDVKEILRQRS